MRTRQRTHASASLVHVRFEFSVTLRSSGFDPGRWSGGVWGGFFHIRCHDGVRSSNCELGLVG
jgi:hypothetical protein